MSDSSLIQYLNNNIRDSESCVLLCRGILSDKVFTKSAYEHLSSTLQTLLPEIDTQDPAVVDTFTDFIFELTGIGYDTKDTDKPLIKIAKSFVSISADAYVFNTIWACICKKLCEVDLILNEDQLDPIYKDQYEALAAVLNSYPEYDGWFYPWLETEARRVGFQEYYMPVLQNFIPKPTLDLGCMMNLDVLGLYSLHLKMITAPADKTIALGFELK